MSVLGPAINSPAAGKYSQMITGIEQIFQDIDRSVQDFQQKTGLSCANGCGRCCLSPNVEATEVEMYPIARHLFRTGQADHWYTKAQESSFNGRCIFYKADAFNPNKGRCGIYPFRPAMCRLYGFSSLIHKSGRRHLMTCAVIKEKEGLRMPQIQNMIDRGLDVPINKNFSSMIFQVHPVLGCRRWPINQAFKMAVESFGLFFSMKGGDFDGGISNQTKAPGPAGQKAGWSNEQTTAAATAGEGK